MPRANPAVTLVAYAMAPGSKGLLKIDGGHFGLLYPDGHLRPHAVDAQARFLAAHLVQGRVGGPMGTDDELTVELVSCPDAEAWPPWNGARG